MRLCDGKGELKKLELEIKSLKEQLDKKQRIRKLAKIVVVFWVVVILYLMWMHELAKRDFEKLQITS